MNIIKGMGNKECRQKGIKPWASTSPFELGFHSSPEKKKRKHA